MAEFDDTHECPIDGCRQRVAYHQLMCRSHWRMVPYGMARRLYTAWDRGRGAGTEAHAKAMRMCVHDVNSQLRPHAAGVGSPDQTSIQGVRDGGAAVHE